MTIDLPDTEEMIKLLDDIFKISMEIATLEVALKKEEARITREAQSNEKYFQNGKPPSQTYVDNAYKYTGFDYELVESRTRLAVLEATLWRLKGEIDTRKSMIDIWRTQAANERTSFG